MNEDDWEKGERKGGGRGRRKEMEDGRVRGGREEEKIDLKEREG